MNNVMHFEIPARNMQRAKKFYTQAFGWKINEWDKQYYLASTSPTDKKGMVKKKGAINGGIMPWAKQAPNTVLVVSVKNLDQALVRAKKAGAKVVMPKMKVENILYYARVKDTEGNVIGLAEPISS